MSRVLIASCAFGLESIVAHELRSLGYRDPVVANGRVLFTGADEDVARCNVWLRAADRVLLRMGEFKALDFEDLYQGVLTVPWEEIIPLHGVMHVTGKSVRSKLASVPDCQSVTKKAVVEAMKRKHRVTRFPETGPTYRIEVSILNDRAVIALDTTGEGLHKRGYRTKAGEAPLRETLAAAMVYISRWKAEIPLADPLCGSGTIPLEAALMGLNIAPGLSRRFAAEEWPHMPAALWTRVREEAAAARRDVPLKIYASDRDERVVRIARANAERAGVARSIAFRASPVERFEPPDPGGMVICNPPYGERIGKKEEVEGLYRRMGEMFSGIEGWSFFILSAHPAFERFYGEKAHKNRKLYNGPIRCYLYHYPARGAS